MLAEVSRKNDRSPRSLRGESHLFLETPCAEDCA
jgi:hypothetical protein